MPPSTPDGTPLAYSDDEPPEHARFAEHLRALDRVPPAEESALIGRVLADPDPLMAVSAVVRHLDARATALHGVADEEAWRAWTQAMEEAVREEPFLTTRLKEWTLLHRLTRPSSPTAQTDLSALATASDWLQRRLAGNPDAPAPVLAFLAEHGRTRKIRTTAAARTT